ncbi:unnamed protein product [Mycena citricolor]|uniref:Uncharacterized protein n=1 Tax=Mycena citricolor TaxID=2018698 RepID=A0AAD2HE80_9AGAR|nr:unnamed protein product [Mycena citricolor]
MSNFNGITEMKSFFIGKYEIKLPIVQGGMGVGVSLNGLASAVANEGGVGVISAAGLGLLYPGYKGSYSENPRKTYGVIGINIMVALSNFPDMVRTAVSENADVIFAGAGLPLDLPGYLTEGSRTQLVPIVSSSRAARLICEKWSANYGYLPDAIVVEGPKAGGHLGFKKEQIEDEHYSLEHLIPEVVEVARSYAGRKNIPVIAAGGIATGEDIARFMALGASAVQMGSIFVPTEECDASVEFKKVYLNAHREDIRIIQSPVGMPDALSTGSSSGMWPKGRRNPAPARSIASKRATIPKDARHGFIADIRRLLKVLPAKRQTLFFSATMPKDIVALSGSILHDPVRVEVTPVSSTVDTVDQCVYFVEKPEKKGLLISVLKKESDQSVLVFSRTKHGADNISRTLKKAGIQSEAIHGNKSQGQRQRALSDFKSGKIKVMVATDIAARGIDIHELNLVINYDLPDVAETYVHRIGRTGRAGHTEEPLRFTSDEQRKRKEKQAKRLEKQKRKEERQATGTSSFDDMIAYVDENGNFTDVPPEERKKEAVKLEDIVIAVPKKDDSEPEIQRGRVEHFNEGKGYGFIKDLTSGEKYFFHVSSAPAGISEGNTVTFETERSARGMNAINITLTK